jgi:hypothetical protein
MDRNKFARSRMLIVYADGTTEGSCSLHCTLEELRKPKKRIKALMVADQGTKGLIDAQSAFWVVGGRKKGPYSPPQWAFATEAEARQFAGEHGGQVGTYDQAVAGDQSSPEQGRAGLAGRPGMACDGPGALMSYNPGFGEDIYSAPMAGMWMVNYRFTHTSQSGLRDGTTDVSAEKALDQNGPYAYMMVPTSSRSDMSMLMVNYGLTDRIGLMGMATYNSMNMNMLMNMGGMNAAAAPMRTSGFGDTESKLLPGYNAPSAPQRCGRDWPIIILDESADMTRKSMSY